MYLRTECCFFYGFNEIRSINNQKPYYIHKLEIIDSFQCFTLKKLDNRRFSCFDDVINKMFVFLTSKVPFFSYISNVLLF